MSFSDVELDSLRWQNLGRVTFLPQETRLAVNVGDGES